jgi:hypothetical protein
MIQKPLIAIIAFALGVEGRRPVDYMQTLQTRSTGLLRRHEPCDGAQPYVRDVTKCKT